MTQAAARGLPFLFKSYGEVALCSGSAAASAGGMNGGRGRRGSRTPLSRALEVRFVREAHHRSPQPRSGSPRWLLGIERHRRHIGGWPQ